MYVCVCRCQQADKVWQHWPEYPQEIRSEVCFWAYQTAVSLYWMNQRSQRDVCDFCSLRARKKQSEGRFQDVSQQTFKPLHCLLFLLRTWLQPNSLAWCHHSRTNRNLLSSLARALVSLVCFASYLHISLLWWSERVPPSTLYVFILFPKNHLQPTKRSGGRQPLQH